MQETSHNAGQDRYMRGIQLPDAHGAAQARDERPRRTTPRSGSPRERAPEGRARRDPAGSRRRPEGRPGRGQARRGLSLPLVACIVAALAIIVGSSYLLAPQGSSGTVPVNPDSSGAQVEEEAGTEAEAEEEEPEEMSTPRSEWRKGEMPYLYQIDPQYADASYSGGTFAKQGCGPCALSMVYVCLTGNTDLGPLEMAEFSTENGFSTDGNGSSWTLMSDGAAMIGLSSETLPAVPSLLAEALEEGHPLICVMAPGTFTEVGHYIAIERLDEDGKAVVHDSNSVERSSQTWDLELICNEAVNIWSFSAA